MWGIKNMTAFLDFSHDTFWEFKVIVKIVEKNIQNELGAFIHNEENSRCGHI